MSEIILYAGLPYAALILNSHPQIASSISKHGHFHTNPMKRVYYSLLYMHAIFFGTREERDRMIRLVNRMHGPVKAPNYDARDPKLQLYTTACFFVSVLAMQETFFGELTPEARESLYQEASQFGTVLQMPQDMWPENLQCFWEYWDREFHTLEATPEVKLVVHDILYLENAPLPLRILMPFARAFTICALPEKFRVLHGLQVTWISLMVYNAILGFGWLVYPFLPAFLRHAHITYLRKEFRTHFK